LEDDVGGEMDGKMRGDGMVERVFKRSGSILCDKVQAE
jgi:hypothetical protein